MAYIPNVRNVTIKEGMTLEKKKTMLLGRFFCRSKKTDAPYATKSFLIQDA